MEKWGFKMASRPKRTFQAGVAKELALGPQKSHNWFQAACLFFPQQRKLMGSSAQISSGVCRCGSQEQVPEEGSGRFRKVPESSGVCWCGFRRRVSEGSGEFRCVLV